jgi:hypothetical protein
MESDLSDILKAQGADLVSCADLRELPEDIRNGLDTGISIAVKLDPQVVNGSPFDFYNFLS